MLLVLQIQLAHEEKLYQIMANLNKEANGGEELGLPEEEGYSNAQGKRLPVFSDRDVLKEQ